MARFEKGKALRSLFVTLPLTMTDFLMDVDGPEFLLELQQQIAAFREQEVTSSK